MAKIPENQTMEPVPSPPPLPSKKSQEMDESSHSTRSTRSSKKLSSMMPTRLSEGSLGSLKKKRRESKKIKKSTSFSCGDASDPFLPKRIGKSKSMNAKLDKPSNKKKISSKKSSSFSAGESSPKKVSSKRSSLSPKKRSSLSPKKVSSRGSSSLSPKRISFKDDSSISTTDDSSQRSSRSSTSSTKSKISSMIRPLSDGSLKKKRISKSSKVKKSESDPFLPTRIGKSNSMNAKMDDPSSSSRKKISSKKSKSFSGQLSPPRKVSRSSIGSFPSPVPDDSSQRSNRSTTSEKYRASQKRMSSMSSSSKDKKAENNKEAETNALIYSLIGSFTVAELAPIAATDNKSNNNDESTTTTTRKVHFDEKVHVKNLDDYSELDRDVIWFSEMEIMEHRKREQQANRKSRKSSNLDLEGMFTLKERNTRNSRVLEAYEAVFDMQLVNKKEKELEDAVGLFRLEAFENDHEEDMAEEYMILCAPAMEDAVMRATRLELHVQLLWDETNNDATATTEPPQDTAPKIPKRKASHRNQAKPLVGEPIVSLVLAQ